LSHAQLGRSAAVQSAARAETGVVHRSGYGATFANPRFEFPNPARISVLPRRDSHDLFENSLQMKGTDPDVLPEVREGN